MYVNKVCLSLTCVINFYDFVSGAGKVNALLLTFSLIPIFAAAAQASTSEKADLKKDVDFGKKSACGIEDLFGDSPASTPPVMQQPQKDVKSDIMSLFEKVCTFAFIGTATLCHLLELRPDNIC